MAALSRTGLHAVVGIILFIVEEKITCRSHCITADFIKLFCSFQRKLCLMFLTFSVHLDGTLM